MSFWHIPKITRFYILKYIFVIYLLGYETDIFGSKEDDTDQTGACVNIDVDQYRQTVRGLRSGAWDLMQMETYADSGVEIEPKLMVWISVMLSAL